MRILLACLIVLVSSLQLASAAEDVSKPEPVKPVAISELHSVKLMNLALKQTLLNQERQALMAEVCAEAKMETCQLTPDMRAVYEVKRQEAKKSQ